MTGVRFVVAGAAALSIFAWSAAGQGAHAAEPAGRGDRVLVLLAAGFNTGEHWGVYTALRAAGYAVDVAAPEKGTVFASPEKPNVEKDVPANLALSEVDATPYAALVIPGGYSPGNLEKHPKALDICRQFMDARKPVAAVCHGPRLLMRAGLLKGRAMTCLYSVADELADEWRAGDYGTYLDWPVVVHENLITSRYPGDMTEFSRALLNALAVRAGRPFRMAAAKVLLVVPGATPHQKWLGSQLAALIPRGKTVAEADIAQAGEAAGYQALAVLDEVKAGALEKLKANPAFAAYAQGISRVWAAPQARRALAETLPRDAGALEGRDLWEQFASLAAALTVTGEPAPPSPKPPPVPETLGIPAGVAPHAVAVALWHGFDEACMAALLAAWRDAGKSVVLLGPAPGELRGLNGVKINIAATYGDTVKLAPGAVVVAPGGVWPKLAAARQAVQPKWVEEQEAARVQRLDWIVARRQEGAFVLAFGFDALALGAGRAEFKGFKFACSPQAVWSFGKEGASYTGEPALLSGERLITARGAADVPEALRLLDEALRAKR